jgi:hypothetical protein
MWREHVSHFGNNFHDVSVGTSYSVLEWKENEGKRVISSSGSTPFFVAGFYTTLLQLCNLWLRYASKQEGHSLKEVQSLMGG